MKTYSKLSGTKVIIISYQVPLPNILTITVNLWQTIMDTIHKTSWAKFVNKLAWVALNIVKLMLKKFFNKLYKNICWMIWRLYLLGIFVKRTNGNCYLGFKFKIKILIRVFIWKIYYNLYHILLNNILGILISFNLFVGKSVIEISISYKSIKNGC